MWSIVLMSSYTKEEKENNSKMCLDLQKTSTYAHNDKAQFTLPFDSLIYKVTNHH